MDFERVRTTSPEVSKIVARYKKHNPTAHIPEHIYFSVDNNYTICTILPHRGRVPAAVGISKRNLIDQIRPEVGRMLAFKRALINLNQQKGE